MLNYCSPGIRKLQLMLLKIALLLGVAVHVPVEFHHLVEPDPNTGKIRCSHYALLQACVLARPGINII